MIAAAIAAAAILLLVYAKHDPESSWLFPRCMVFSLTGLKCPGCGTQRALHHLLDGDVAGAWNYNAALIVSLPLIALLFGSYAMRGKYERLYLALNSKVMIMSIFFALSGWMVARNIFGW